MSDPSKQLSVRKVAPLTRANNQMGNCTSKQQAQGPGNSQTMNSCKEFTPDYVKSYLASHPKVLEEYVQENVSEGLIEKWLVKKQMAASQLGSGLQSGKAPIVQNRFSCTNLAVVEKNLLADLSEKADYLPLLHDFMEVVATALKVDESSLYAFQAGTEEIYLYIPTGMNKYELKLKGHACLGKDVISHAAKLGEVVFVDNLAQAVERFPDGAGLPGSSANSALCLPLTMPTGDCLCIMEFTRNLEKVPFRDLDMQTVMAFGSLMGNAAYQCQMNKTLLKQFELNEFLLDVSKEMFDDMIIIDNLVEKIMSFTKDLVQADRCSVFLVDHNMQELYADIFDTGEVDESGKSVFSKQEEIRFPVTVGIAGHVATTQEVINISSAYKDSRFNKDVDKQTGYITNNILCMPIVTKGAVMGVVQMINKRPDNLGFTKVDENSFKMFAIYSALALHYSKLYREILQRSAQHRVALEQVTYHACSSVEECSELFANPRLTLDKLPKDLASYDFYGPGLFENELQKLFIHMMDDFGLQPFDMQKVCRFIQTIKKNYRLVAYHNWKHGWNVAHCLYCCLKSLQHHGIFSILQIRGLMVAGLCHDVDHRGYNNAFFKKFNEPLATLYSSSVMEQHHYATTVNLLQQEGHDIFSFLNSDDYKETLEVMKHAIISTDLALYFGNQKNLAKEVLAGNINLKDRQMMNNVVALLMTAADLCAVCKPWAVQEDTVKYIYEEFYFQGDEEKRLGSSPIPMMDRENMDNMPKDQVGFIKFVCMPCYQTLYDILPETQPLLDGCKFNLEQWQRVVEGKSTEVWEPGKSRVQDK